MTDNEIAQPSEEIWKKWLKTKTNSRFLSIKPWLQGKKFILDIGIVNDTSLQSNSSYFVNMGEFITILELIILNYAVDNVYMDSHSVRVYGGSVVDGEVVSRIFSISPFPNDKYVKGTSDSLSFRIVHCKGHKTSTGAIMPSKPNVILKDNSIRITQQDILQIAYACNSYVQGQSAAHAIKSEIWSPFSV